MRRKETRTITRQTTTQVRVEFTADHLRRLLRLPEDAELSVGTGDSGAVIQLVATFTRTKTTGETP